MGVARFTGVGSGPLKRSVVTVDEHHVAIAADPSILRELARVGLYVLSFAIAIGLAALSIQAFEADRTPLGLIWAALAVVAVIPTLYVAVLAVGEYLVLAAAVVLLPIMMLTRPGRRRLKRWWTAPSVDDSRVTAEQIAEVGVTTGAATVVHIRRHLGRTIRLRKSGPNAIAFASAFHPLHLRVQGRRPGA